MTPTAAQNTLLVTPEEHKKFVRSFWTSGTLLFTAGTMVILSNKIFSEMTGDTSFYKLASASAIGLFQVAGARLLDRYIDRSAVYAGLVPGNLVALGLIATSGLPALSFTTGAVTAAMLTGNIMVKQLQANNRPSA